jgi:hypothetical protein
MPSRQKNEPRGRDMPIFWKFFVISDNIRPAVIPDKQEGEEQP